MRNIDTTGKFFDLDKVVVSNWIKQPGNISEHTNQNNPSAGVPTNSAAYPSSAPVSRKSSGPLIGGVIAAVTILALVLLIISIWIYRRSRRTLRISNDSDTTNVELGGEDPVSTVSSQAITESLQRISDTNVPSTSGNANTSELHTHMRHPIILGALLPVRPSSSADEQRTSSTAIKSIHRSSLPALVNPASFRLDNGDDADITDDLPPPNYDEAMAPVSTTGINF
ncbi:hypothetical protein BC629DRAFT_529349 [Irpex lacteus]|nr:hypothetical protein BC629DRAFT_529349 [Irpex lacteus]